VRTREGEDAPWPLRWELIFPLWFPRSCREKTQVGATHADVQIDASVVTKRLRPAQMNTGKRNQLATAGKADSMKHDLTLLLTWKGL
jgi:hypothetical protein